MENTCFDAMVLAGSRGPGDPVASHAGMVSKAMVPVAGTPMLLRVLSAVESCPRVARIVVVGLAEDARRDPIIERSLAGKPYGFHPGAGSPAASVAGALDDMPGDRPILVTTADHALLRPDIVEYFLGAAEGTGADAVVGLVPFERVAAISGQTRRTVTRLRDGAVCGCNLFAFLTAQGRDVVTFWQQMERHRKHPARIARMLGAKTLLKFVFRRLTLAGAMDRLSKLGGARVGAVLLPFGEAAIDVDTPADLAVVESLAGNLGPQSPGKGFQSGSRLNPPTSGS